MSPAATQPRLLFDFQEFFRELIAMNGLAHKFLAAESQSVLLTLRGALESIQNSGKGPHRWEIPQNQPLKTTPSTGYEKGKKGRQAVFASITGIWEIEAIPERRKRQTPSRFGLIGNASVHVQVFSEGDDSSPISTWKLEVGAHGSPGCYFHLHIDTDDDDSVFPSWLPVPRFPSYLATPTFALEFALGELFQEDWPQTVGQENNHTRQLHPIQRKRLIRQLEAQQKALEGSADSPWVVLKQLEPGEALFVG